MESGKRQPDAPRLSAALWNPAVGLRMPLLTIDERDADKQSSKAGFLDSWAAAQEHKGQLTASPNAAEECVHLLKSNASQIKEQLPVWPHAVIADRASGPHRSHRKPPLAPPPPGSSPKWGNHVRTRLLEAFVVCLLFLVAIGLSLHAGYALGQSAEEATVMAPSEQQELAQALKRLSEAERLLGRRQGHAPSASPPVGGDRELTSHMASSPVSRLYEEDMLPNVRLDAYDLEDDNSTWHRSHSHLSIFDGPASWMIGEAPVDEDLPRKPIYGDDGSLLALERPLRICLLTADFWGKTGAGGTATAYSLLASALDEDADFEVKLLAVTKHWEECEKSRQQQKSHVLVDYLCLAEHHFQPEVIETYPYERLSHATLAWLKENQEMCDVLQVHEWGGVFSDIVAYSHLRQFRPGLRIAINTHGGHYWSTEGQLPRPTDIMSLRIDHGERTTLELSDIVLSPTRYMMSWLRQRGWHMPADRHPLPNLISGIEEAPTRRVLKPVWRLAFFGRLEERKGIKLFVDAVDRLPSNITSRPGFEVIFMGSEAKIDQLPSGVWLNKKTAHWNFTTRVYMNMPGDEAMKHLKEDGILLVQASMIDNMPYVLAEASVNSIPLVIYDVGGVTEMIDPKLHKDVLVGTPKGDDLAPRVREILEAGHLETTVLSPRVTTGRDQWRAWHHDFAVNRLEDCREDDERILESAAVSERDYEVVTTTHHETAIELYEAVCDDNGCSDIGCGHNASDAPPAVLLLPEEFEVLDLDDMPHLVKLLNIARERGDDNIGALVFGAEVPFYKQSGVRHAFPTAPTWQLYEGEVEPWLMSDNCTENVPVLIRRATFCGAFNADARNFHTYSSFTLSLMLAQAGLRLTAFPEVPFRLTHWSASGYQCILDKTPDRRLDLQVAANLMNDDALMLSHQLTPVVRPFVDFVHDFSDEQSHRGWEYGYANILPWNVTDTMQPVGAFEMMTFMPAPSRQLPDGVWKPERSDYPSIHRFILHPCAGWELGQCAGYNATAGILRFNSFLAAKDVVVVLVYEVFPRCGDGVEVRVALTPNSALGPEDTVILHREEHGTMDKPLRQRLHFLLPHLGAGDLLDLLALPKGNHDCDGVLVLEAQIWDRRDYHQA